MAPEVHQQQSRGQGNDENLQQLLKHKKTCTNGTVCPCWLQSDVMLLLQAVVCYSCACSQDLQYAPWGQWLQIQMCRLAAVCERLPGPC